MREGGWDPENGETIKMCGDQVIDGRHRLNAIIASGRTVRMAVVRGVSKDAFKTLDTGKKRSMSDLLTISGYSNTNHLAAAIRTCIALKTGGMRDVSNADGLNYIKRNDGLIRSLKYIMHGSEERWRFARLFSPGRLAGVHYIARKIDRDTADYFIDRLLLGDQLEHGDPILTCRAKFVALHDDRTPMHRNTCLLFLCKTWNAWRDEIPLEWKITDDDKFELL
jgi:hypothetical protein